MKKKNFFLILKCYIKQNRKIEEFKKYLKFFNKKELKEISTRMAREKRRYSSEKEIKAKKPTNIKLKEKARNVRIKSGEKPLKIENKLKKFVKGVVETIEI